MLREEDLDPATIRRLMDQYEAEENWNYKRSQRQDRLINLHTGKRILAKHKDGLSREAPKPRTFDICKWKGADLEGKHRSLSIASRLHVLTLRCRKCLCL